MAILSNLDVMARIPWCSNLNQLQVTMVAWRCQQAQV